MKKVVRHPAQGIPNRFYSVSVDLFSLFKPSIIGAIKSFSER